MALSTAQGLRRETVLCPCGASFSLRPGARARCGRCGAKVRAPEVDVAELEVAEALDDSTPVGCEHERGIDLNGLCRACGVSLGVSSKPEPSVLDTSIGRVLWITGATSSLTLMGVYGFSWLPFGVLVLSVCGVYWEWATES